MLRCLHELVILLLITLTATLSITNAYTYEPPGRDPISIDNIRNSELSTVLTTENFDELTKGKLIFIKFYAPYCPHCKDFAPTWNKLSEYYAIQDLPKNDNILIGTVDCTDAPHGKALCARFKIVGLPTLLYGDASLGGIYLEEWGGDKTLQDLKSVPLVPKCNPGNLDACAAEERRDMETFIGMSYGTLASNIKEIEGIEEELRTGFKQKFDELQSIYDQSLMDKEVQIVNAKGNIKLIKEVMAMKE